MKTYLRGTAAMVAALALSLGAAACGSAKEASDDNDGKDSSSAGKLSEGFKIGLLLPETKTARYEKFDRPYVEHNIKKMCPKCEVIYENADQDANKQQRQVDTVLTRGVKVLMVDAVDYKSIAGSVRKAKKQGVKVVAYDRLAQGPIDAYASFDNRNIGKQQGHALLKALKKQGGALKKKSVVLLNGSPTDPNAGDFKKGVHSVLDDKVKIAREYDIPDWSPDKANKKMTSAISAVGKKNIDGVYAANDGMAGGAISALKHGGFSPLPPVTGQDSEITGVQRILSGSQSASIYKMIKPQALAASKMAVQLGQGKKITKKSLGKISNGTYDEVDNKTNHAVPSIYAKTVILNKKNVGQVFKDGYWKKSEICTEKYEKYCSKAGL